MDDMPLLLSMIPMNYVLSFHNTISVSENKLVAMERRLCQFTTTWTNRAYGDFLLLVAYPKRIN